MRWFRTVCSLTNKATAMLLTRQPFAGSWPFEPAVIVAGLGLLAAGERLRRRGRRLARDGPAAEGRDVQQ